MKKPEGKKQRVECKVQKQDSRRKKEKLTNKRQNEENTNRNNATPVGKRIIGSETIKTEPIIWYQASFRRSIKTYKQLATEQRI